MFDEIYTSLNKKIDQELQSTGENSLAKYSENKFANIKMLISDFSVEVEPKETSSAANENWERNLAKNKDFRKLKEYIDNLKVELYSQKSDLSALKEKLRISEAQLSHERQARDAQAKADKQSLWAQKKEWQAKMDRLLEQKKEVGLKCEEMVEYVDGLVKSNFDQDTLAKSKPSATRASAPRKP